MTNTQRTCIGLAVLALTCGLAGADTLTESFSSLGTTATDFTGAMTASQFNPALGTLESVEINIGTSYTTTLTVTNTAGTGSSGSDNTDVKVIVEDQPLTLNGNGTYASSGGSFTAPELSLISPEYDYNITTSGGSSSSGLLAASGSTSVTFTGSSSYWSAIVSEFTGTSVATLYGGTATSTLLGNNGGNANSTQVTNATITGDVIYTYAPPPSGVPEPTTLFLMGSALVGVGLIRKRAKA